MSVNFATKNIILIKYPFGAGNINYKMLERYRSLFVKSRTFITKKILDEYKNWKIEIPGSDPGEKFDLSHKNFK